MKVRPSVTPVEDDGIAFESTVINFLAHRAEYESPHRRAIIDLGIEFVDNISGELTAFGMIPLAESEKSGLADVLGTPCCYTDYRDGKFEIWPMPDRDIEAVVTVVK